MFASPARTAARSDSAALVSSGRFSRFGNRTRCNSRSRGIGGATQRHLSVAHFYVHSQQRAHTEQWFRHRPAHKHRVHIAQKTAGFASMTAAMTTALPNL
jgi:hypothetical protein